MNIAVQCTSNTPAECPKCRNREGIRDGGPGLRGHRSYDIWTDTYGLLICPRCHYRAHYSEFHSPRAK